MATYMGDTGPAVAPPSGPPVPDYIPTWTPPPPAPTQTSGSTYYTGGNPWTTGYPGTMPKGGSVTGGGMMGGSPFPWGGFMQANQQAQNATEQGLAALMSGMAVKSPFGQQVGNLFSSPYGLPPHLLAQQQRMLSETAAGSRANQQQNLTNRLAANGFAATPAAAYASSQIDANSARDLNNAQTQLAIQDAMMQMQRQQGMGGLMAQLYGMDAGLLGQYAQMQGGRQFPIMPGQGGMGAQPVNTGPWWSQSGQYMTSPMPYDPFYQGGGPGTGQGTGYSPSNPWKPW